MKGFRVHLDRFCSVCKKQRATIIPNVRDELRPHLHGDYSANQAVCDDCAKAMGIEIAEEEK